MATININKILMRLSDCDLSQNQRKALNAAVRNLRARRRNGGRLHHPSHYVPQICALARKFGVLSDGETIARIR